MDGYHNWVAKLILADILPNVKIFYEKKILCKRVKEAPAQKLLGDQLNMAVCFWDLVISDLFSLRYCPRHFIQGTRKTQPYLTGHPVVSILGRVG